MRDVYLLDEIDGGEIWLVDPQTEHVQAVADMLRVFNEIGALVDELLIANQQWLPRFFA